MSVHPDGQHIGHESVADVHAGILLDFVYGEPMVDGDFAQDSIDVVRNGLVLSVADGFGVFGGAHGDGG